MEDPPSEKQIRERGRKRAESAESRGDRAREREKKASREASEAATPESTQRLESEAELHRDAARMHDEAVEIQRHHVDEHPDSGPNRDDNLPRRLSAPEGNDEGERDE